MWQIITDIGPGNLATFIAGGLLVNLTPGQDVFFATASGLKGGPRAGVMAGLGVGIGALWHVALSAFGLSALIAANPMALHAIKYAGAAYLLYIAWKSWRDTGEVTGRNGQNSGWSALRKGALTNMLNPKPILFMLAFLPQFVNSDGGPVWMQILLLGTIFGITGTLITVGYGYLAGRAGHAIAARMGMLNKVAAVLFAALAARLITE
ncbi:threonine transporter RhtB [Cypionkella aquatica]|uniref:Threonine transporter RhtB n=1 Tax=Cypionkella aquatica TaxID=1756042 RepID=A0AA37X274_9RHOB|nr:LysE family translocator [Cypionkella aquatica]GLS85821.1 threonine transporter RhtB [Cypionkella aquatica]